MKKLSALLLAFAMMLTMLSVASADDASIITASARPSGAGWITSFACSHGILPTGILC